MQTLGQLGLKAMVPGHRDLSAGVKWLMTEAKSAGVALVSANLKKGATRVFSSSAVMMVQGVKVGIVGLSPVGPVPGAKEVVGEALGPELKAALTAMGPRDITVVLAAVPYAQVMALDPLLTGVDFVVQSSDLRGTVPGQRLDSGAVLLGAGQRGQALNIVSLSLAGAGRFEDAAERTRAQSQVQMLEGQLQSLAARLEKTSDLEAKAQLKSTLKGMQARRDQLKKESKKGDSQAGRSFQQHWELLSADVADDPALKKKVLVHEPSGAGAH